MNTCRPRVSYSAYIGHGSDNVRYELICSGVYCRRQLRQLGHYLAQTHPSPNNTPFVLMVVMVMVAMTTT